MKFESDQHRIFGLDIVRAIAVTLVVMVHGAFMLNDTVLEGFPFFKMIDGVDVFFVLSGFLIGGILLKEIEKPDDFNMRRLMHFWKRRWFRTFPNYYLILLANYLVVKYGIINEDINQFNLHFLTFTQNFKSPFFGFFWESWSLSVEEWFYLFTPIIILLLCKKLKAKHAFLVATLIMVFFSLIYRIGIFDAGIDAFAWDGTFRKTVLSRLDSTGYGLLTAWIYFYHPNLWKKTRIPALVIGAGLLMFILNFHRGVESFYKQTIYFSLVPICVMFFLPAAEGLKKGRGVMARITQHISKISYSMYLINLALVAEVIRDNFAPTGGIDGIIKYGIYWTVVVVASTILYRCFELPVMKLRDKL